uniref:Uncharacterized protein n=1 Tax=Thelazia callipaeda TaxID=103827 RepID=A0A0N5CTZ6_THECL
LTAAAASLQCDVSGTLNHCKIESATCGLGEAAGISSKTFIDDRQRKKQELQDITKNEPIPNAGDDHLLIANNPI